MTDECQFATDPISGITYVHSALCSGERHFLGSMVLLFLGKFAQQEVHCLCNYFFFLASLDIRL